MSENWDDHAGTWDESPDARAYADCAFASLIAHVDLPKTGPESLRMLDFGCGTGLLTEKLAPFASLVVAIDTSQKMIDVLKAKRLRNVRAVCADIAEVSAQSPGDWRRKFDLVVASSVCGFVPDYEAVLSVLSSTLMAQGQFVQWDWLTSGQESSGLSLDRVGRAITGANMRCVHVGEAFAFGMEGQDMPVLIGVGCCPETRPVEMPGR